MMAAAGNLRNAAARRWKTTFTDVLAGCPQVREFEPDDARLILNPPPWLAEAVADVAHNLDIPRPATDRHAWT